MDESATENTHGQQTRHRTAGYVRVLQEPVLHFLVLGTGLFAAASYFGEAAPAPEDGQIVVTEGKVRSLAQLFQRTWQRPPTQQELDGLIRDHVDEEVFYREALAMGLDRNDTLIRRRLRQKLEFVAEDLADAVEPTDDELRQHLADNPEQYRLESRTTFTQIYFSPQRRGESLDKDVQLALDALSAAGDEVDLMQFGDPTLLPTYRENLRESEIADLMGGGFGRELMEVEAGVWAGPIESSYGVHLVRVQERTAGRTPSLNEVRDAVRRGWFAQRRAQSKQKFYDSLRERYEVIIEMPGEEAATGDGPAESDTAGEEAKAGTT